MPLVGQNKAQHTHLLSRCNTPILIRYVTLTIHIYCRTLEATSQHPFSRGQPLCMNETVNVNQYLCLAAFFKRSAWSRAQVHAFTHEKTVDESNCFIFTQSKSLPSTSYLCRGFFCDASRYCSIAELLVSVWLGNQTVDS